MRKISIPVHDRFDLVVVYNILYELQNTTVIDDLLNNVPDFKATFGDIDRQEMYNSLCRFTEDFGEELGYFED